MTPADAQDADGARSREALAPTLAAPTPTPASVSRPSTAPDDTLPPGEILGARYRIVELVGRGGQGDVYRADDLEVEGHVVALKLMHHAARSDEEKASAMRELRMLAAVSHPTIVQFKDSGWYGARLWFVMPWLEGRTLEQAGRISRAEARRVFESVAAGVAALHAKGMRHQDIKPSNIFLARIDGFDDAMPVLLDLGVAARGDDAPIAGSPDYFAPEVAAMWPTGGDAVIGPEADVYAIALALRNSLDPDTAPTLDAFSRESLDQRAKEPVAPPSTRELAYLEPSFERWLAIEPERRPTAATLMRELAVLTAPEDRAAERARTIRRIAPWAVGLVLTIGWFAWWGHGELLAHEKAAARAAEDEREAELRAHRASEEAELARDAARDALERAASSEEEADDRERQARAAMARVRAAQRALDRAQGDRARLGDAIEEMQRALTGAEAAREQERRARETERAESERALRAAREGFERERRELTDQRDRALVAITESEVRGRTLEQRTQQAEALAAQAQMRAQQAEARASELEGRLEDLEARLRRAERAAAGAGGGGTEPPGEAMQAPTDLGAEPTLDLPR
ncbi:serine/threonine-protein kinase [Sandaracinus amylolyticus]|uniref:serine/threonine-protein kinase n=1 Tax=Sandaracinus amylolyticus TaxID=927083 RepID=UPI001F3C543B|nr:serine/threonine-protein kinase [Sandaracinus amylolyticus]UJR86452.1 Hypothetical protein I5071_85470 [Sandaracinus amylolyticus]